MLARETSIEVVPEAVMAYRFHKVDPATTDPWMVSCCPGDRTRPVEEVTEEDPR
jgi:hypothetical protein